jgi:hypothetical protein
MPFIGAEFTANIFSGAITFVQNSGSSIDLNYNRNVRYGVSFGAGAEYPVNKNIGLIAAVKYSLPNIIGKEFDNTGAHDLNDKEFTINGFTINDKTIAFLNFYAGVCLYIGDR